MSVKGLIEERLLGCSSELFEVVCCEVVRGLGFTNVSWRGSHRDRDRGRDIEGHYHRLLPNGRSHVLETWFFECKHLARRISVGDIQEKVNWALAEKADFLVIMSLYGATSECLDYAKKLEQARDLKVQFWDRQELARLIAENPSVLTEYYSDLVDSVEAKKQIEAEERLALARNLLSSIGVMRGDLDARRYSLLREVIGRIVRKQDIHTVEIADIEDGGNAVVYLLGASGHGVEEKRLCSILQTAIRKFPESEEFWRIAQDVSLTRVKLKRKRNVMPVLFVGPVASGKSCLIARLLITFASDSRFSLDASSFLDIARLHRMMRDKQLMPATPVDLSYGIPVSVVAKSWRHSKDIEIIDTAGGLFERCKITPFPRMAIMCLIFDPTERSILRQDDPGDMRPCKYIIRQIDIYRKHVAYATERGWPVVPLVTKCDLIDVGDLRGCVMPQISNFLKLPVEEIIGTSVLMKREDRILQNALGIDRLVDSLIRASQAG